MLLFYFSYKGVVVDKIREVGSYIIAPIRYSVSYPAKFIASIDSKLSSKSALVNENTKLRYENTLLKAKLQKLLTLKNENTALRHLLNAQNHKSPKFLLSQLLAIKPNPFRQLFELDKGEKHGVFVGQAVLDANGIAGQIVYTSPFSSTLLLLSDSKSAIPVENSRTKEKFIAEGIGDLGKLKLLDVSSNADIKPDDIFISSGLGGRYPQGYPVATVSKINKPKNSQFMSLYLDAYSKYNKSNLFLLLWPSKEGVV